MTDTANKCTYISPYWHDFTGRDPAKDLGFTWIEALHPEDRQRAAQDLIEASAARRPCSGEYRLRRADGEYAWFHDVGVAYFNADGSWAGYVGTCVDITQHKKQAWAGRRVRQALLLGQEAERKRLALELHDDISQKLVLAAFALGEIAQLVPAGAEALNEKLRAVRDQVKAISLDVHRLSHNLHPATVAHLGLVMALERLCEEFSEQARITVEFVGGPIPDRQIEEDLALALFRITQEALTNVAKHSGSRTARVSLREESGSLHLAISDQGSGFDVDRPAASTGNEGLGLTSMRERASLIGAELTIRSAPSKGTEIDLIVPLRVARTAE
jgi:PAS domain S-box-containing protein